MKSIVKISLSILIFGFLSILLPSFILRSGAIDISYKYLYILILLLYFILFLILERFINIKKYAILLSLPLIFLTIYGLNINFSNLFPAFFPAVNIIFLVSIIPFLVKKNRIKIFIPLLLLVSTISYFGFSKILVNNRLLKKEEVILNLNSLSIKDSKNKGFELDKKGSYIIDCIFTRCAACIYKFEYLTELANKNLKVYVLIDGEIDSFEAFESFQNKYQEKFNNLTFLYDSGGIFMKNHHVDGYPIEFLIKDGVVIGKEIGFSKYDLEDYIKARISLYN